MIREMKEIIKTKIKEIGFNFNPEERFKKEMINITFSKEDSEYFPTYNCWYYSDTQHEGIFNFKIRFSINNQYIDYIDLNSKIEIIL